MRYLYLIPVAVMLFLVILVPACAVHLPLEASTNGQMSLNI